MKQKAGNHVSEMAGVTMTFFRAHGRVSWSNQFLDREG